jgi:Glycosyl hydrolase family 67 N-terminus
MKIVSLFFCIALNLSVLAQKTNNPAIKIKSGTSFLEQMASKELVRYIYLRTGTIPETQKNSTDKFSNPTIIIGSKNEPLIKKYTNESKITEKVESLKPQQYFLKTISLKNEKIVVIIGGDELGALYGTYAFIEKLGVRFYLEGDVIPDQKITFQLPEIEEEGKPLFETRGLNPWGSHPFGFDQWSADDYKSIMGQMLKMKMNFIVMHNYSTNPYNEPTVWLGEKDNINPNGKVKSSYPARYYSTLWRGIWGPILPKTTTDYSFGASQLFENESWGPITMKGFSPTPRKKDDQNELFNRVGKQFNDAFSFAKKIGIKTALGTETPMSKFVPVEIKKQFEQKGKKIDDKAFAKEIYKGTFERIKRTHPLDYYWLWTPEDWTWNSNSINDMKETVEDLKIANEALIDVKAPFKLATSGWVLGPVADRSAFDAAIPKDIPMSALNRNMGHVGIDPAFKNVTGRDKWAIPWLESDGQHGLAALQLYAGRSKYDAVVAKKFDCTGFIGLHWRTRELGPNASAFAQAAWDWSAVKENEGINLAIDKEVGPMSSRKLSVEKFYNDFAIANFGSESAGAIAKIFSAMDGNVPISVAVNCPAGSLFPIHQTLANPYGPANTSLIVPDDLISWEKVAQEYPFVEQMERVRSSINGKGNLDRFDFWLNTFKYHRQLAKVRWTLSAFELAMKNVKKQMGFDAQWTSAMKEAVPAYGKLVTEYELLVTLQMSVLSTNGGVATVVNLMQNKDFWQTAIENPANSLKEIIGNNLPEDILPSKEYKGKNRIFMVTQKTSILNGESFEVKVTTLGKSKPTKVTLNWKPMGAQTYSKIALSNSKNGIYSTLLEKDTIAEKDFEYYVEAVFNEDTIYYPATAKEINNTVIVLKE